MFVWNFIIWYLTKFCLIQHSRSPIAPRQHQQAGSCLQIFWRVCTTQRPSKLGVCIVIFNQAWPRRCATSTRYFSYYLIFFFQMPSLVVDREAQGLAALAVADYPLFLNRRLALPCLHAPRYPRPWSPTSLGCFLWPSTTRATVTTALKATPDV